MPEVVRSALNFQREALRSPFGFKGGYVDELWRVFVTLTGASGRTGAGSGVQSVLWSDSEVFTAFSPAAGNAVMLLVTEYCAGLLKSRRWTDPIALFEEVFPEVLAYAQKISGRPGLRPTFALNAMVPADIAVWRLHAAEAGFRDFEAWIPANCAGAFTARHEKLAAVPLIPYGTTPEQVREMADAGYALFKIKIGSDPDRDGDVRKMLAWDKARIREIHAVLRDRETPLTDSGRPAYYLDANGRYDTLDHVRELLEDAAAAGALERVVLLEEPFPDGSGIDVSGLPVVVAADESAHSDRDAAILIELGYRAIALKPIAKTLSMSFKIAAEAARRGVPCFCADLTVDPLLVDYNKCFAARLGAIPGMKTGILESNGPQNYVEWDRMLREHPTPDGEWIPVRQGVFTLGDRFYRESGGIFG